MASWRAAPGGACAERGRDDYDGAPARARCLTSSWGGFQYAVVITGFNTDVKYRGVVYHVQTEDKGTANPLIETLIYKGGEILASRRLPYADLIKAPDDEAAITKLMEDQHKGMILEIKRGKFDPAGDRTVLEDLSLDEIVLAYLAARATSASK
jgi:hypothetical protein